MCGCGWEDSGFRRGETGSSGGGAVTSGGYWTKQRSVAKFNRERDLAKVALLRRHGKTQAQIAVELKRSPPWVNRRCKWLEEAWRALAIANRTEVVANLLDKYTYVWAEAMGAWESSKGKQLITRTRERQGKGQYKEAAVEQRESDGDPRYLAEAMKALTAMRELLIATGPAELPSDGEGEPRTLFEMLMWAKTRPLTVIQADGTVKENPPEEPIDVESKDPAQLPPPLPGPRVCGDPTSGVPNKGGGPRGPKKPKTEEPSDGEA